MILEPETHRFIVITSIFPPTEAVRRFAQLYGWQTVVVGDRKTPGDWDCPGVTFLSAGQQEKLEGELSRVLPWNHYSRKMLGYLHAIRQGARVIADTDDDNLPKPHWSFPEFDGEFQTSPDGLGFVNVYKLFTDAHVWPRGLPLQRINDPAAQISRDQLSQQAARVAIWQGLADGDPDVDAIYRMTDNTPCTFEDRPPVVLGAGTLTSFNSQNTLFRSELFPLLYLPATVTFRFTDILRGLVAQPILWLEGWRLGVSGATVVQERNPHDYLKDFESEIPCYLHGMDVVEAVGRTIRPGGGIGDNLREAYRELVRIGIVPQAELPILQAWLNDLAEAVVAEGGARQ